MNMIKETVEDTQGRVFDAIQRAMNELLVIDVILEDYEGEINLGELDFEGKIKENNATYFIGRDWPG